MVAGVKQRLPTGRAYDEGLRARAVTLAYRVDEPTPPCWLCDSNVGPRAKEHIFPRWLVAKLKAENHIFEPSHYDVLGNLISSRGPVPAAGFTAGEVCKRCNGGWMSDLEQLFGKVAFAVPRRGAISDRKRAVLARWFAKTAVVMNTSQNYRLLVPATARHTIAGRLSPDFHVFLARHPSTAARLEYSMGMLGPLVDVARDQVGAFMAVHQSTLLCAIRLDTLVGVVLYRPGGPCFQPVPDLLRIWPTTKGLIRWSDLPAIGALKDCALVRLAPANRREFGITRDLSGRLR